MLQMFAAVREPSALRGNVIETRKHGCLGDLLLCKMNMFSSKALVHRCGVKRSMIVEPQRNVRCLKIQIKICKSNFIYCPKGNSGC